MKRQNKLSFVFTILFVLCLGYPTDDEITQLAKDGFDEETQTTKFKFDLKQEEIDKCIDKNNPQFSKTTETVYHAVCGKFDGFNSSWHGRCGPFGDCECECVYFECLKGNQRDDPPPKIGETRVSYNRRNTFFNVY